VVPSRIAVDPSLTASPAVPPRRNGASVTPLQAAAPPHAAPSPPRRERVPVGLPLALGWLGMATLGFNVIRVGGLALSDWLFFLCGAVIVGKLLLDDNRGLAPARSRGSTQLVKIGTLLLLTAGVLATFVSWGPTNSLLIVVRLGYLTVVWFWMLHAIVPTRGALNVLLSGWRFGTLVVASLATLGQLGFVHIGRENPEGRQMVFFGHPNDLGCYLLAAAPLLVLSLPEHPHWSSTRRTLVRFACVGLLAYAITTTGSITALFAVSIGAVAVYALPVLFPVARRTRRRVHPVAVMAGCTVALVGIVLIMTSDLPVVKRIERLDHGDSEVEGSVQSREQTNDFVIRSFDQRLIFGVGLDNESVFAAAGQDTIRVGAHNMYLKVLYEAGLPGLIGLLTIQFATFRAAFMLLRNTADTELYPIVLALIASALSVGVFAMFQPTLFHRWWWLPLALIWCVWELRREEIRQFTQAQIAAARAVPLQQTPRAALPGQAAPGSR
jgi:O-antigen ligase